MRDVVRHAERGLINADLGGDLIKQRVARKGQGQSGGYRMLIAYRTKDRAVFLYGFAKNEGENIAPSELATLREIATTWLSANPERIALVIAEDELQEVPNDYQET